MSDDGKQVWSQLAYSTRGFVVPVFSYNLHEARGYNRAAAIARGKYLIFAQVHVHECMCNCVCMRCVCMHVLECACMLCVVCVQV